MKECPFCAEEIQDDATKCKHCRSFINAEKIVSPVVSSEYSNISSANSMTKDQAKKSNAKRNWIIGIVALLVIFGAKQAIFGLPDTNLNGTGSLPMKDSKIDLDKLSDEVNKGLPKKLDDFTILTKTSVLQGKFVYSYKLLTEEGENYSQSDVDSMIRPMAVKMTCSAVAMRKLVDGTEGVILEYKDGKDSYIGKTEIRKNDCQYIPLK